MESNSLSAASDLSSDQRQVIESMLGRTLGPHDMIFLSVFRQGQEPTAEDKARARTGLERLFQKIDRFGEEHGVNPAEADAAIDDAVRDIRSRSA